MQLERVHVQGIVADGLPCFSEIDDLRKLPFVEVRVNGSKKLEDSADRVLREIGELRPREQFHDLCGEVRPDLLRTNTLLF